MMPGGCGLFDLTITAEEKKEVFSHFPLEIQNIDTTFIFLLDNIATRVYNM